MSGTLWFDVFARTEDLGLEVADGNAIISLKTEKGTALRAFFEDGSRKLHLLDVPGVNAQVKLVYDRIPGGFRVFWREVTVNGEVFYQLRHGAYRTVSGFELPTVFRLTMAANTTEYRVRYLTVNGRPAEMKPLGVKAVKALVSEYESGWRKWSDFDRIEKTSEISNIDHDLEENENGRESPRARRGGRGTPEGDVQLPAENEAGHAPGGGETRQPPKASRFSLGHSSLRPLSATGYPKSPDS